MRPTYNEEWRAYNKMSILCALVSLTASDHRRQRSRDVPNHREGESLFRRPRGVPGGAARNGRSESVSGHHRSAVEVRFKVKGLKFMV